MGDNSRNISLIGEVENSSREQALVAQRLETGFLTVRSRVRFPPGSVGAHCWRVPNRTKQLSSAPASFRLLTLLINDELKIVTESPTTYKVIRFEEALTFEKNLFLCSQIIRSSQLEFHY